MVKLTANVNLGLVLYYSANLVLTRKAVSYWFV